MRKSWVASVMITGAVLGSASCVLLVLTKDPRSELFQLQQRFTAIERRLIAVERLAKDLRDSPVRDSPQTMAVVQPAEMAPDQLRLMPNDAYDRLAALQEEVEQLRTDVLAAFDSVSPIQPLDSAEEELARAELFEERKMWKTAIKAYLALLQRYPDYASSAMIAKKALQASRLRSDLSPKTLPSIEEALRRYPNEDSFEDDLYFLGQAYFNMNQHADTARVLGEVTMRPGANDRLKTEAYWTLSFAVREMEGEAAFLETLEKGRSLAAASGLATDSFDEEIVDPRPRRPQ